MSVTFAPQVEIRYIESYTEAYTEPYTGASQEKSIKPKLIRRGATLNLIKKTETIESSQKESCKPKLIRRGATFNLIKNPESQVKCIEPSCKPKLIRRGASINLLKKTNKPPLVRSKRMSSEEMTSILEKLKNKQ